MNRVVVLGFVAVLVGAAVVLYLQVADSPSATSPSSAAPAKVADGAAKGDAKGTEAARRSVLPRKIATDGQAPAETGDDETKGRRGGTSTIDEDPKANALVGLGVRPMDDGLREKLKVPDDSQIGFGVLVTEIHPDSPAAEIFMRPNDVIVRAAKKKVNNLADLEELVGDRDHTLLTVSRDGALVQMVLKKPWRPKPAAGK